MRVLIIKTSSLGDVIHTLPALSDAARAIPGIRFDWVVEESFAEIPAWHPAVATVIPVAIRRWRKHLLSLRRDPVYRRFVAVLAESPYDAVIDAQGLLKSAWIGFKARGPRHGLDADSAREPLASWCYQYKHRVPRGQHAVERVRQLFAQALGYALPDTPADYGLDGARLFETEVAPRRLMFLHGTTWVTKHWPESYWRELARLATAAGYTVRLPWGSAEEEARARRIAGLSPAIEVLPKLNLRGVARELASCQAAVAVDTGLGHLAAALAVPTVSLYGPTNPALTRAYGPGQVHLAAEFQCAPCLRKQCTYTGASEVQPACFGRLPPERVWQALEALLAET
ncbi:MAG: lipopolysaccharide heptosyltransferase I [Gammaproteobacteria bacterium]|nr:lipopolysaccharide heptosyltransferase I [Gammaproteobacteria bacterium]